MSSFLSHLDIIMSNRHIKHNIKTTNMAEHEKEPRSEQSQGPSKNGQH